MNPKILFNKPFIVAFPISDITKTQIYKFHYEYMKKEFPLERLRSGFTYTDSLIHKILEEDVYAKFKDVLDGLIHLNIQLTIRMIIHSSINE